MEQCTAYNERFGVMAAEAHRNGSANLEVCTPQEVQWKSPSRCRQCRETAVQRSKHFEKLKRRKILRKRQRVRIFSLQKKFFYSTRLEIQNFHLILYKFKS